jgi:hypothetical protein
MSGNKVACRRVPRCRVVEGTITTRPNVATAWRFAMQRETTAASDYSVAGVFWRRPVLPGVQ